MTYNHPVWDQQDTAAARAVLRRLGGTPEARARKAGTAKERAWLHAVEMLYGPGSKVQRDTLYEREMEKIARDYPRDDEAQLFYALALIGLSQTTRVVPTYLKAGAIAESVFVRRPDHPGAAHYVIHAYDDPVHADMGLKAARAYSGIAPGAAHAQHMTTHIFLALGMWDDVVKQNIVALGRDTTLWKPGHYSSWLEYGLLQQGRFKDALGLLDLMVRNMSPSEPLSRRAVLVQMRDYYVINAERWDYAPPLPNLDGVGPIFRAEHAFTTGYAALKRGQVDEARAQFSVLRALTDSGSGAVGVMAYELAGVVHLANGDTAGGLSLLRQATAIEDTLPMEFGPPLIVKPSHELLGEILLNLNQPGEAKREFERALALAPRRLRSIQGLEGPGPSPVSQ
jgi:tetratricopeptide (TPR) repeat protein